MNSWLSGCLMLILMLALQLGLAMAHDANLHEQLHHHGDGQAMQCIVTLAQEGAWQTAEADIVPITIRVAAPVGEIWQPSVVKYALPHHVQVLRVKAPPRAP